MGRFFRGILTFAAVLFVIPAFGLTNSQPATHPSNNFNVWLVIEGYEKGEQFTSMCNGSLIADDLVVTAAHCLAGSTQDESNVKVSVGQYKDIVNKNTNKAMSLYQVEVDVIKSKKFYFPKAIDKKIRSGKFSASGNVAPYFDVALIQLERPVDKSKINVDPISFVTPEEYKQVMAKPQRYNYIALSTNLIAEMTSTSYRRYAEISAVSFSGLVNKAYSIPMINPTTQNETEPGDSGAPVLVNVSGKWKLLAVIKGVKKDLLSDTLGRWSHKEVKITPVVNMYTTVASRMCELLEQAGRSCN